MTGKSPGAPFKNTEKLRRIDECQTKRWAEFLARLGLRTIKRL